ncbi:MAG: putative HAD-hydrolase YfnB [Spirochaetes bacterium ADurb.Bin315]|nr:MAG: putative HAD-hydrolase YfnB [Spirochaetes bacterium ADurb.Bin315]
MYHHLFLDLDGTLMDFREAQKRAFTLMAEQLRIPINDTSHEIYDRCNHTCWKEFEQGLLTIEELTLKRFVLFREQSGLRLDPTSASTVYEDHLSRQAILYPQTLPLLTLLSDEGYRLHLASNGISGGDWNARTSTASSTMSSSPLKSEFRNPIQGSLNICSKQPERKNRRAS